MTGRLIGLVSLFPLIVLSNCGGATMPDDGEQAGGAGISGVGGGTSVGGAATGSTNSKGGTLGKGGTPASGSVPASGGWIGVGGTAGYGGSIGGGCIYDDFAYSWGDIFPAADGCNTCACSTDGILCTAKPCSCYYAGAYLGVGTAVEAGDGCNYCTCEISSSTGSPALTCTKMACPATCLYAGTSYASGASFPATDGCNKCSCNNGSVSCSLLGCTCNPSAEYWRTYVSRTPTECALLDFICPTNSAHFSNACGCGCEQSPDCPQYFQCVLGTTGTATGSAGATGTAADIMPSGTGGQAGVAMPVPICATAADVARCPLSKIPL